MKLRNFAGRAPAALLAAALLAGCEPDLAAPFTVDAPGNVEALAFFDADENGAFDPAAGDRALSGIRVQFRVRGTTQVLAGGSVTSDAQGRIRATGLPAGTHDLWVDPASLPAGVVLCANPLGVTVDPGVTRFVQLQTRGGCLVAIAAAKTAPVGSVVVVRGIVTSFPGQIRGSYTYIQDGTAGIRIFDASLEGRGIQIGDRIEISGTISLFNDDFQISGVTLRDHDPNFGAIAPQATTTGAIAAAGPTPAAPLQGRLVRVSRAQMTGAFGSGGVNIRNGFFDDGSGATQVRIEAGVLGTEAQVVAAFTLGKCYDITGVVGNFRGAGQLFPRSMADVTEVPCS